MSTVSDTSKGKTLGQTRNGNKDVVRPPVALGERQSCKALSQSVEIRNAMHRCCEAKQEALAAVPLAVRWRTINRSSIRAG